MYKIHHKNKVIWLLTNQYLNDNPHFSKRCEIIAYHSGMFNSLEDIDELSSNSILVSDGIELLRFEFFSLFVNIAAAGGVVLNDQQEICLIFRNGVWDLPKGKIEKGESPEVAAVREVEEETGLKGVSITKKLPDTFHTYQEKGRFMLKTVHWYKMISNDHREINPQLEEGITEVVWKMKGDLDDLMKNSYESIQDTLKAALRLS